MQLSLNKDIVADLKGFYQELVLPIIPSEYTVSFLCQNMPSSHLSSVGVHYKYVTKQRNIC